MLNYTTLTPADIRDELNAIALEAERTFGHLTAAQLNWRPDATRWSVAQCFEHLLTANHLMMSAADAALDGRQPLTVWMRIPGLSRLFGRLLIRSQTPGATRKFTAPTAARPSASDIPRDVIARFVAQCGEATARVQALDERRAAVVMTSPFVRAITYSVLDGWRLIVAHDRRHIEQARRIMDAPGFPAGPREDAWREPARKDPS